MSVRTLAGMAEYRRLFGSRLISNIGNGVAPIAIAFGVLALPDGSPTGLSIVRRRSLWCWCFPSVVSSPTAWDDPG